ncbi:HPr family phosphocarrier protein [Ammoniphilus sp. YIM 78166]|uniref:HPr family phosphocarrier protein n=1 Tax=Ammoniphilus sp. YIM 78166 TaxID=1644106 RepID=UPI0014320E3E|nr:HPr family phosphocarrier protein [Ammoniphilus sp. YIM 78166]
MLIEEFVINSKRGLHLRPATQLASVAQEFTSDIKVGCDGKIVPGKSALGLLKLEVKEGHKISILIDGEDEEEAMKGIMELIRNEWK